MYRKKSAQTATEYLVILAVVIIIALIVINVMGGIPGIGGSSASNTVSAYWRTSDIGVDGIKASVGSDNSDSIILRNNLPNTIVIDFIRFGDQIIKTDDYKITLLPGKTKSYTSRVLENDIVSYYTWNFKTCLNTGDLGYYTDDFDASGVDGNSPVTGSAGSAGDTFAETLIVQYTDQKTNATYTFTGDEKLEGECTA